MDVKLVMAKGRPREHTIQLRSEETVIGRHKSCNLRVPSSDVSRRHCVVRIKEGRVYVEDLGSTNGTLVNGEPITGNKLVRPGDELEIGPVSFTVEYSPPAADAEPVDIGPLDVEALDVELVESVPDVEVLDEEEEAVIVIDDSEDGELFNFQSGPTGSKPPAPDAKKPAAKKPEAPKVSEFDLDKQSIQLPDEGDLRDILSQLDR